MRNKPEIRSWTIYKITNPVGQVYVGRTINLKGRLHNYKYLSKYTEKQPRLYESLKKYGFDAHSVEILDSFDSDIIYADGKEIFWIRTNVSNVNLFPEMDGLNMTIGGSGAVGKVVSDSTRVRIGLNRKGRKLPPEQVERMREYFKANPSRAMLGRSHSTEARQKISLARKGMVNTWNKGKRLSEDQIIKLREIQAKTRGRKVFQYDINGDFLKEYPSIMEASRQLGIHQYTISCIAKGLYKTPPKFIFKYE
jgi:group I intron endonuclease